MQLLGPYDLGDLVTIKGGILYMYKVTLTIQMRLAYGDIWLNFLDPLRGNRNEVNQNYQVDGGYVRGSLEEETDLI